METKTDVQEIKKRAQAARDRLAIGHGFVNFLGETISLELDKALGTVIGQLEDSFIDSGVTPGPIDVAWLIKITKEIANVSMYKAIDADFADFVTEYAFIVSSWNDRAAKSEDLYREIAVAESLANSRPAIIVAAKALRRLSEKLIQLNFVASPALNMSRFYLDSLRKEFDKKDEQ